MAERNSNLNVDEKELLEIQEELKRLRPVVQSFKLEKQKLEEELPVLTQKVIDAKSEYDAIIANANIEAQKIKDDASTLYAKVKKDEEEANKKIGEANDAIVASGKVKSDAEALLKSNQGREANLEVEEKSNQALKIKLLNISKRIKEMLEE